MDARDVIDAYLQGRIESWGVFRRLRQLGLTTATALAVAGALPAAVQANDAGALKTVDSTTQESPVLELLVQHLASQLEKVEAGGPVRPLAATLARIGANNLNLANCNTCDPVNISIRDGFNSLDGTLVGEPRTGNLSLNLNGNIGQSNINLIGSFDNANTNTPNANTNGRNLNIGNVNMNVAGNIGGVPLNLNGNLGNLSNTGNDQQR